MGGRIVRIQQIIGWTAVGLATALGVPGMAATARRTPVVEAVEKALPSVVNIGTEQLVQVVRSDPFQRFRGELFDRMFGELVQQATPQGYQVKHSLGSGVLIDSSGYILTNFHVIERATAIRVTLVDGRPFTARLVAGDELNDLALIKIDPPHPLAAIRFARDGDLLLGESVIALGNPFGLAHSVTVGVLSARNREAKVGGQTLFRDILQTDAAVNPGSSGGPLINVDGELIGVNVSIHQEGQNIGFAVPVNRARALLTSWLSPRALGRLWTGVDLSERDGRLLVIGVQTGGPADASGLKPGDAVIGVNGLAVSTLLDYHRALLGLGAGDEVRMACERAGEAALATFRLTAIPKPDGAVLAGARFGLQLAEPDAADPVRGGLVVKSVQPGGPAALAGIQPGMRLTRIAGQGVASLDDVGLLLEPMARSNRVAVSVAAIERGEGFLIARTATTELTAN